MADILILCTFQLTCLPHERRIEKQGLRRLQKNWWREKDYYDYDQADALMNKKIQSVYILCVHRIHTGIIVKQMCTWSCSYYKNRYIISDTSQKLFDHHSDRSIWTTTMGSVQTIDLPKWMNHCFTHSHHKCPYYRILFFMGDAKMRTIFFCIIYGYNVYNHKKSEEATYSFTQNDAYSFANTIFFATEL